MRKAAVAGVAAIAVIGAAAAAVPVVQGYAASRIKTEIERNGVSTVDQVEVSLLERRIALTDLKSASGAGLSIKRWEVWGLGWPLAELLRGRVPLAGWRWGDPLQADRIEVRDLRTGGRDGGGGWSIESLSVEGLGLERFDGGEDSSPDPVVLVARALTALSFRRLDQRGTVFSLAGGGDTVGVASIALEGYQNGRVAGLTLAGIEATAGNGRAPLFRVADVAVSGLDASRLLTVYSSADWQPGAPMGRVRLDRAAASGFSGETMARYGISLGSVTMETAREGDTISRSRTRIDGFVLAPPLRGLESLKLRLALQAMGLREIKLGFDCAGTEDRDKGEITIDRCALSGPNLADINFTARLAGADEAFWQAVDDGEPAALYESKAALESARLVLADGGLLERALKALAATTGQALPATRANIARDIRRFQPADVLITQELTMLLDTVARFVEQGGTLTLEARPEPPLAVERIDYLMSPGADLVNALGLKATLAR